MTRKDLEKVEALIGRYNYLPKTADFKIKAIWENPSEQEKKDALSILDEIDGIFAEIRAFVKVKFGVHSEYLRRSHAIDFQTEFMGIPIITNSRDAIHSAWSKGMHEFGSLLRDMRLETIMLIESQEEKENLKMDKKDYPNQIRNFVGNNELDQALEKLAALQPPK